jgi:hypothetical protein
MRRHKIDVTLGGQRALVDLHAKRIIAVLAVALTVAGSGSLGMLAGQLPRLPTLAVVGVLALVVVHQLAALAKLAHLTEAATADAVQAIDRLITQEVELGDDDAQSDP